MENNSVVPPIAPKVSWPRAIFIAVGIIILLVLVAMFALEVYAFGAEQATGQWQSLGAIVTAFVFGTPVAILGLTIGFVLYGKRYSRTIGGLVLVVSLFSVYPLVPTLVAQNLSSPVTARLQRQQKMKEDAYKDAAFTAWLQTPGGRLYKTTGQQLFGPHHLVSYASIQQYFVLDNGMAVSLFDTWIDPETSKEQVASLLGKTVTFEPLKEEDLRRDKLLQDQYQISKDCSYMAVPFNSCIRAIPAVMYDGSHLVNLDFARYPRNTHELQKYKK